MEKRQNQWFGKEGNGGYAKPEMRTKEDNNPEIGIEELAQETMRRILIKRSKQNASPAPRRRNPMVNMEQVRFESPKRKRGEETISSDVPQKKKALLQKAKKGKGESDNLDMATPSTSTGITDANRHTLLERRLSDPSPGKSRGSLPPLECGVALGTLEFDDPQVAKITPYAERKKRVRKPRQLF